MASHADFWIATASTSPVIALAAIVGVRDALILLPTRRRLRAADAADGPMLSLLNLYSNLAYGAAGLNVGAQGVVLLTSLAYLANGTEHISRGLAIFLEGFGIVALLVGTGLGAIAGSNVKRAADEREAAEQEA